MMFDRIKIVVESGVEQDTKTKHWHPWVKVTCDGDERTEQASDGFVDEDTAWRFACAWKRAKLREIERAACDLDGYMVRH